jgi:hypothetical protein
MTNPLSPFSVHHEWTFIPDKIEDIEPGSAPLRAPTEIIGLQAIADIGLIGSVQAGRLFHWQKRHLHRMLEERKLIQHILVKNKNRIPVYSIGPRGAQLLQLPFYPVLRSEMTPILQKLVFFQFCCALRDKQKAFRIESAAAPFTGQVTISGDRRNVLVIRESLDDQEQESLELCELPMIVVAEALEQVPQPFPATDLTKLLLDEDLKADFRFYRYKNGKWEKRK